MLLVGIMIVQTVILSLLVLAVFYGVSFIVDMIFHRWWANLALYVVIMGLIIILHKGVDVGFIIPLVMSFAAVILASFSVKALRNRGYRMFRQ